MLFSSNRALHLSLLVLLVLALGTSTAGAAALLTGADIKDESLNNDDIQNGGLISSDYKDNAVKSEDLKDGNIGSVDLANGSVTADKIAPGAIAFPNSLWSTLFRNQAGAAVSNVQAGPGGAGQLNDGSLRLSVSGPADLAAFGNSFEFAGVLLEDITGVRYSTYNADVPPLVRPSLRFEIEPHLVADDAGGAFEFTTLIHEPPELGQSGWAAHTGVLADNEWYLTGSEGTDTGCIQGDRCTFAEILTQLEAIDAGDPAPPAISTGIYFALGSGVTAATETAVDEFALNGYEFDFEPSGVFVTPAGP